MLTFNLTPQQNERVKIGKNEYIFQGKNYILYVVSWEEIRTKRDALLKDSDWSVAGDATPKPSKEDWLTYRQALRDLPQHFENPSEVVWPNKPE
jgi:hypothetical protein